MFKLGLFLFVLAFGIACGQEGSTDIHVNDKVVIDANADTTRADSGVGVKFLIQVGPIFNFVTAFITMPSGKRGFPLIVDNADGTVTIKYQPQETGRHELNVFYNHEEIPGSPFKFHVDAVNTQQQ